MRTIIATIITTAAFAAAVAANAQSPKHTNMDLKAAKLDIIRLEKDRAMARRHHAWKKVAQDNRLIAKDKAWIRKDAQKLAHKRN